MYDAHLSLNAFIIRSTSSSLWKAEASRLSSFSSSASEIVGAGALDGDFKGDDWADMSGLELCTIERPVARWWKLSAED